MRRTVAPKPLEYAPPLLRRQTTAKWIAVGLAVLLASGLIWRAAPTVWRRSQLVYWQQKCLEYAVPPNQIVFSAPKQISIIPHEWLKFQQKYSDGAGMNSKGTVFLHERISPGGHRWLVAVDVIVMNFAPTPTFGAQIISPLSLKNDYHDDQGHFGAGYPTLADDDTVYAGQADEKDASHFTIRIAAKNKDELIDGWLMDNGNVLLEWRKDPISTPSQSPKSLDQITPP